MIEYVIRSGTKSAPALGEAAALQEAFPSYSVNVTIRLGELPRFELVAREDANPWCLISSDPSEIWRELAEAAAALPPRTADGGVDGDGGPCYQ